MKITRRRFGAAALAPAALLAQNPPAIPSSPAEELAAVKDQNRRNSAALDKFPVPMATEPAFVFKA